MLVDKRCQGNQLLTRDLPRQRVAETLIEPIEARYRALGLITKAGLTLTVYGFMMSLLKYQCGLESHARNGNDVLMIKGDGAADSDRGTFLECGQLINAQRDRMGVIGGACDVVAHGSR